MRGQTANETADRLVTGAGTCPVGPGDGFNKYSMSAEPSYSHSAVNKNV